MNGHRVIRELRHLATPIHITPRGVGCAWAVFMDGAGLMMRESAVVVESVAFLVGRLIEEAAPPAKMSVEEIIPERGKSVACLYIGSARGYQFLDDI